MSIDRRKFIKTSLASATAIGVGNSIKASTNILSTDKAPQYRIKSQLKISFQEGTAPGANLNEKFDYMEKHGVVGFEPHGGNIPKHSGERTAYGATPVVAEQIAVDFEAVRVLVVVDVVVVRAVVYHLCHEQVERRYSHTQTEEVEQRGYAVAAEHI